MDKYYLISVIERLKSEIKNHDQKFKDNPIHNNCQPRFEKTLTSLQEELVKAELAYAGASGGQDPEIKPNS